MIIIVYIALITLNIIYLKDIKNLIIPAKMRSTEWIALGISLAIIAWVTFSYGTMLEHYILGVVATLLMILAIARRGVTSKGFTSFKGIARWGRWESVKLVIISIQENEIKAEFSLGHAIDIHFYKSEDYDRLVEILRENLSNEVIRIIR